MGETKQLEEVGYLQDIIGYIFDQRKIVTYKWISNDLGIHVNRAKRLLYTFIKHLTDEKLKELKVTYFIGGILNEDEGHHFQIVSEEELEKVKAQYNVITSEHIYSICLNNSLPDLHSLCSVDGVKSSKAVRNGAICYTKGHPRSEEEISSKRQGAYHAVDGDRMCSSEQLKQTPKNEKKPKDAPSISSMFSAANNKAKSEKEIKEEPEGQKQTSTTLGKKGSSTSKSAVKNTKQPVGRLAALFSAQNSKPKPAKKENKEDNGEKEKENSKKDVPEVHNGLKAKDKTISVKKDEPEITPNDVKSKTKSQKSQQKKRKRNDHKDRNNKKRKRIVVMNDSDSSSDDPFSSDKEEKPPSPDLPSANEEEEEVINIKEDEEVENRKKVTESSHRGRKRCLVDKTFIDEEGYLVTKKVYEFVSCSESENEEKENEKTDVKEIKVETQDKPKVESQKPSKNATKPQKDNKQKKNSPDQKKQATLMNFFKRS